MGRRIARGLLMVLGGLLGLPIVLLLLALLALQLGPARAAVVTALLDFVNGMSSDLRIEVDEVHRLDPWGIDAHGLALYDLREDPFLTAGHVEARIAPLALTGSVLRLRDAAAQEVEFRLPEFAPSPKQDQTASTFVVEIDRLRLSQGRANLELGEQSLRVDVPSAEASGRYGPSPVLALSRAEAKAWVDGQEIAELSTENSEFNLQTGGSATVTGTAFGAPIQLSARFVGEDDPRELPVSEVRVRVRELSPEALNRLALTREVQLGRPLSLRAKLAVDPQSLALSLSLQSGPDTIEAEVTKSGSTYRGQVEVAPTELSRWSGLLPELKVQGKLNAEVEDDKQSQQAQVRFVGVEIAEQAVPNGSARLRAAWPQLELESLEFDDFRDALAVKARYQVESGNFAGQLDLSSLSLSKLLGPKYAGAVSGGVRLSKRGERLDGKASLSADDLDVEDVRVKAAELSLSLGGTASAPTADVEVGLRQVKRSDVRLSRLSLQGALTPAHLHGQLALAVDAAETQVELDGTRNEDGSLHVRMHSDRPFPNTSLRLDVLDATYGAAGDLTLNWLELCDGEGRLTAKGALTPSNQVDLSLKTKQLPVATWLKLAGVRDGAGALALQAEIQGPVDRPDIKLDAELSGFQLPDSPVLDAALEGGLSFSDRALGLSLSVRDEQRALTAELEVDAELARARRLERQFLAAHYRIEAELAGQVATAIEQWSSGESPIAGRASFRLDARGTLEAPQLESRLTAKLRPASDDEKGDTTDLALRLALAESGDTQLELLVSDGQGKLLELDSKASLPIQGLPNRVSLAELMRSPAEGELLLSSRELSELSGVVGYFAALYGAELPGILHGRLRARSDGQQITGSADFSGGLDVAALSPGCQERGVVEVALSAELKEGELRADVRGEAKKGGSLTAKVEGPTRLSPELSDQALALGPLLAELSVEGLPLRAIPGLCGSQNGSLDAEATLRNVLAGPLDGDLKVDVQKLSAFHEELLPEAQLVEHRPRGPSLDVVLSAKARGDRLQLRVDFREKGKDHGGVRAELPLRYEGAVPAIPSDEPIAASVDFSALPVGPLMAISGQLGQGVGTLDAQASLHGTLAEPSPKGHVALHDVGFSIASIAQPLSGINGKVVLSDHALSIDGLRIQDRDGHIKLGGRYEIDHGLAGQGEVKVHAEDFPLRQQGSIIGTLDLEARLSAQVDRDSNLDLDLRLDDGRIWLTGSGGRDVQSLDQHPDVRFAGQERRREQAQKNAKEEGGLTLRTFDIASERRLWVMHEDFSIQVGVDMGLRRREDLVLTGEVTLHRGTLSLLGKGFRIEEGSISFTGAMPPDPVLNIRAVFEPPSGGDLIVRVTGPSSAPEVSFSGAASTAAEAAMVLTGINSPGAGQQAQSDAAAMATGVTAGLLSVTARRELGDWVPVITLQRDAGGVSGATAGFDASNLIPDALEGFARGVYIEGMVGRRGDRQSQGLGVGVKVEVALPQDFITSMGYGPGTSWSTDVFWSP